MILGFAAPYSSAPRSCCFDLVYVMKFVFLVITTGTDIKKACVAENEIFEFQEQEVVVPVHRGACLKL